jgi:hypothetical protein
MQIPYGKQSITAEDLEAVVSVLQGEYLTQGPSILEFEQAFAKYIGVKYAVAVSNGTAALHLSALALDVNSSSNYITSPITFAASANCIRYCGGKVWFADINPNTFLLDLEKTEALIQSKPKGFFTGIILVDFAGYPANTEEFRKLADNYDLKIIEDACHAPGGYFTDSKSNQVKCGDGRYADLSIFSFHPVKHIATGEGGMITTNSEALYKKLLVLRTHGITKDAALFKNSHEDVDQGGWYYEMQELGYNYRLTDFQAVLGTSQLKRADAGLNRRKEIAKVYNDAFAHLSPNIITPESPEGHAFHLYVIRTTKRKELYDYLREKNIFTQVHYIPVHLQPYYRELGWSVGDMPLAEDYYRQCLSLPMYPTLSLDEQQYVIDSVFNFFK